MYEVERYVLELMTAKTKHSVGELCVAINNSNILRMLANKGISFLLYP